MAGETRVVFGSGFESLFSKELRGRVTPKLDEELRALGVRLDKPFLPAYSVEVWASVLELCAKHLYAADSLPEANRKLGRSTILGFCETMMGKALFALLRLMGPVRAIERAARNYAATNNYTQVKLTRVGPTSFDFGLNEKHALPEFDVGVLEEALTQLHVVAPRVTLTARDTEGFTLRLEWNG